MKIGELASASDTGVETIRYYEREGLLPAPARTESNYRSYGAEHLARLQFITTFCRLLSFKSNCEL
ncbi:MAG: MerR family DNA-binding transcriptional regulator [Sphingobacteriales bacterium]|nr:MAG: MerR family DNA-binding transcriptional regulator [Sphingobacteriales bacterium]